MGKYDGDCEIYNENGIKMCNVKFVNGLLEGKGTVYYNNGNLFFDGFFKSGIIIGDCKLLDENGDVVY